MTELKPVESGNDATDAHHTIGSLSSLVKVSDDELPPIHEGIKPDYADKNANTTTSPLIGNPTVHEVVLDPSSTKHPKADRLSLLNRTKAAEVVGKMAVPPATLTNQEIGPNIYFP